MLVNTEIIKNNVLSLKEESKYYKNKTSSFSSFLDDNNKNLSSYIRNINSIYINISNNIESVSNYISDYINDLESVENLMSGKQGYIKSSVTNSVVSKTKNSIKKHIIDDGDIFKITNYSGSSGPISNKNEDKNVNNKSNYSSIISLVKKAISENKDINEILKMYSIVDIRNAMMLFPGVITLDMLNKAFKKDNPFDNIEYPYDGKEDELKNGIRLSDIKNLIYSSGYLNQNEKDFLFNENLLSRVVPLYNIKGEYGNFVDTARKRFSDIQIVSYKGEEYPEAGGGYYTRYVNVNQLHIADYNNKSIYKNSKEKQAHTVSHEYIHLLQTDHEYKLIKEPFAELMSHEFYLESSFVNKYRDDNEIPYTYYETSKYLRILMEIVGSDIIFEANFSELGLYNLKKVLMELLDESDFSELDSILKIVPRDITDYKRLEELLAKMYKNKYGTDMYDNGLIYCILNDKPYNRVYFNDELRNKQKDYYYDVSRVNECSFQEAYNKSCLNIYIEEEIEISEEEYNNYNGDKWSYIVPLSDNVSIYEENNNKYVKVIDSSSEKTFSVNDAINQGYVKFNYYIKNNKTVNDIDSDVKNLSIEEFKKYYSFFPMNGTDMVYDEEKNIFYQEKLSKVEMESLTN